MKKSLFIVALALVSQLAVAHQTLPIKGTIVSPTDKHIQYTGRISFTNPERPAFNYPGTQIIAAFEGTSLRMIAKPGSGYYMAQIDQAEPFKVSFMEKRDSVVTLATALPEGQHIVRLMYIIEGYELYPEFWGFVLDEVIYLKPWNNRSGHCLICLNLQCFLSFQWLLISLYFFAHLGCLIDVVSFISFEQSDVSKQTFYISRS